MLEIGCWEWQRQFRRPSCEGVLSASGSAGLLLIPGQTNDFKIGIHCLRVDAQHLKGGVENKPTSLLVVPLGKTLNGIPPS